MLTIESLTIRGFRSFGETETTIQLAGLGPTLVVGRNGKGGSNGAGKSSLLDAILWVLFGRLPGVERPGDDVIGWELEECAVRIRTSDGYEVERRRRKKAGELSVWKDGVDVTDSTLKNAQVTLNRLFGLDYELFTAGTFFGQFGRAFMELPDGRRRKAIERLLHLHRLNARAEIAHKKLKATEERQAVVTNRIAELESEITGLRQSLEEVSRKSVEWATERAAQLELGRADLRQLEERARTTVAPDLADLRRRWEVVASVEGRIVELRDRADRLTLNDVMKVRSKIDSRRRGIEGWRKESGTVCAHCQQRISPEHAQTHVDVLQQEIAQLQAEEASHKATVDKMKADAAAAAEKLVAAKPKLTIREAELQQQAAASAREAVARQQRLLAAKEAETNPHDETAALITTQYEEKQQQLAGLQDQVGKYDVMLRHLKYLHGMYADRNKLKSLILADLVPYLNSRLSYYLEQMGEDVKLEFNQFLQCHSDKWAYEHFSGGERKRIDVALMFALYDLHAAIYGRQCNVMVLDEIDGRLDGNGVQAFVDVIWKDFAPDGQSDRPDSVLVISHKTEMVDAFPSKIVVERAEGGRSTAHAE